jgi:hypothetical protein
MKTYHQPETVVLYAGVKNIVSGSLVQPATTFLVTVTDPAGTEVVTAQAMVYDGTATVIDGISYNYHYDYQPAAAAVLGQYYAVFTATDAPRVTQEAYSFVLE